MRRVLVAHQTVLAGAALPQCAGSESIAAALGAPQGPVVGTVEDFTALYPADFVRRYDTSTLSLTADTASQVAVLAYGK